MVSHKPSLTAAVTTATLVLIAAIVLQQGKGSSGQLEECKLSKIKVTTHKTDSWVQGNRVFLVVVSNVCWCPQSNITLSCGGFDPVEPVDPAVLAAVGDGSSCLLNGGHSLVNGRPVSFKYAGSSRFRFTPLDSQINC